MQTQQEEKESSEKPFAGIYSSGAVKLASVFFIVATVALIFGFIGGYGSIIQHQSDAPDPRQMFAAGFFLAVAAVAGIMSIACAIIGIATRSRSDQ